MQPPDTTTLFASPYGTLKLVSSGTALTRLLLPGELTEEDRTTADTPDDILQQACRELDEWFHGNRTEFEVPLAPKTGTEFQQAVWSELRRIPFGTTITYTQLAQRLNRPAAVRAVGAANGRNPLPILVPCHRVIGANGSLTGYAGGLPLKRRLLDHESAVSSRHTASSGATMLTTPQ